MGERKKKNYKYLLLVHQINTQLITIIYCPLRFPPCVVAIYLATYSDSLEVLFFFQEPISSLESEPHIENVFMLASKQLLNLAFNVCCCNAFVLLVFMLPLEDKLCTIYLWVYERERERVEGANGSIHFVNMMDNNVSQTGRVEI